MQPGGGGGAGGGAGCSCPLLSPQLPMVLKVPRLNASPLALCDRPFSLLGFGDILVPGMGAGHASGCADGPAGAQLSLQCWAGPVGGSGATRVRGPRCRAPRSLRAVALRWPGHSSILSWRLSRL